MGKQLIKAHPNLTGNIKISISNKSGVYLSTIENTSNQLNRDSLKYVKRNKSSNYIDDLKFIYGKIQPEDLYGIDPNSISENIRNNYDDQYYTTYDFGIKPLLSRKVPDRLSLFAPLYFEDDIPNNFIVFKIPNAGISRSPSTELEKNRKYRYFGDKPLVYGDEIIENDTFLVTNNTIKNHSFPDGSYVIEDASTMDIEHIKNYLVESSIVEVYDLKEIPYIKNTIEYPNYPSKPFYADFDQHKIIIYGIDYMSGSISEKEISIDKFIESEFSVYEFDKFISNLYKDNGLIYPNILNLEFLFDEEELGFHRYVGIYGNLETKSIFHFDSNKLFNELKVNKFNKDSIPINRKNIISGNFKISPNEFIDDGIPTQMINTNTIQIVKTHNSYLKIMNYEDYITIKNSNIEIGQLVNYDNIIELPFYDREIATKSFTRIRVNKNFEIGETIEILLDGSTIIKIIADDLINFQNEPYEPYGTKYEEGDNCAYYFYPYGSIEQINEAISKAIEWANNENNRRIKTILYQNDIVIYNDIVGKQGDLLSIVINSESSTIINSENFSGGTDFPQNNISLLTNELPPVDQLYVLTDDGYEKITGINNHFEISNDNLIFFDEYVNITIDDSNTKILRQNGNIKILRIDPLEYQLLNILPISQIDFDFDSEIYTKNYQNEYFRYFKARKLEKDISYTIFKNSDNITDPVINHGGVTYILGDNFTATNDQYEILQGDPVILADSYFNDEEVESFTGFRTIDSSIPPVVYDNREEKHKSLIAVDSNEYDKYKESTMYPIENKIIPITYKFGLINGKDIRENPYRLNLSSVFGNNYTPGFDSTNQNPNLFTHEWMYLSGQPFEFDLNNNYPYFNGSLNENDINNGGFDNYFDFDYIIYENNDISSKYRIDRQKRYSKVEFDGNSYYTFFRGVRIRFGNKNFDGYRFTTNLIITKSDFLNPKKPMRLKVIENEDQKFILILLYLNIEDYKILPKLNGDHYYEYSYLYMMNSLKRYENNGFKFGINYDFPPPSNGVTFFDDGIATTSFRGIQLYGKINLNNSPFINRLIYENNSLIEKMIKIVDGEFSRIIGINDNFFTTITNTDFKINDLSYEINANNSFKLLGKDYIELEPLGLGLYNISNQIAGVNYDPITLNQTIYPLNQATWFHQNGGQNSYEDIANMISFSNIRENLSSGNYELEGDQLNIDFIRPSELTIKKSLVLLENSQISPLNPEKSIKIYSLDNNDTSFKIQRYNGFYDIIFSDLMIPSSLNIDLTWLSMGDLIWSDIDQTWQGRLDSIAIITMDIIDETWNDINQTWNEFSISLFEANDDRLPYDDRFYGNYDLTYISDKTYGVYNNKVSASDLGYTGSNIAEIGDIHIFKKYQRLLINGWDYGFLDKWQSINTKAPEYGTKTPQESINPFLSKYLNVDDIFTHNPISISSISGRSITIHKSDSIIEYINEKYYGSFEGFIFDWEVDTNKTDFIRNYIKNNIVNRYIINEIIIYTKKLPDQQQIVMVDGSEIDFINSDMINNRNVTINEIDNKITIDFGESNIGEQVGILINFLHI